MVGEITYYTLQSPFHRRILWSKLRFGNYLLIYLYMATWIQLSITPKITVDHDKFTFGRSSWQLRKLESTVSTWTTQEISIDDNQTGIDCAQTFSIYPDK